MHAAAHHTSHHSAAVQVSWLPGWSMPSWSASGGPGTAPAACPGMAWLVRVSNPRARNAKRSRREPRDPQDACVRAEGRRVAGSLKLKRRDPGNHWRRHVHHTHTLSILAGEGYMLFDSQEKYRQIVCCLLLANSTIYQAYTIW